MPGVDVDLSALRSELDRVGKQIEQNLLDLAFIPDKRAQAIVDLFKDNGIATKSELSAFLDDPAKAASVSADIPDGSLKALFVTFDTSLLIELLP